jgi:hypothetical protein
VIPSFHTRLLCIDAVKRPAHGSSFESRSQ